MTIQTSGQSSSAKTAQCFVKYTFYRLETEWRRSPRDLRTASKKDFMSVLEKYRKEIELRTYSLTGTRADSDFMIWTMTGSLDNLQNFHADILRTSLGNYLSTSHSYLAMTRPSEYFGRGGDPEPVGSKYLFVYPFTKKREWYSLPFEERQRMMKQHVQIGHKYTSVTIHTAYSFGLDDYEFILSFETDHPEDFLNLVMDLRSSEASKYTAVETPIFTCISASPERMLDLLGP